MVWVPQTYTLSDPITKFRLITRHYIALTSDDRQVSGDVVEAGARPASDRLQNLRTQQFHVQAKTMRSRFQRSVVGR